MPIVSDLRAAVRPFVARSLRGPRFKRTLALSALLAIVTCVLGAWLALGDGEMERAMRQALRLEKPTHQRMHEEFIYVAHHDDWQYRQLSREREELIAADRVEVNALRGMVPSMAARGYETVQAAVAVYRIPAEHAELAARARALLERHPHWSAAGVVGRSNAFDWTRPQEVARLAAIVDHELIPEVVIYRSPLDGRGAIGLVGLIAGLFLTALATVVGPVLIGIAIGQESHENTLQPLTGTSLSPRQIAVGLVVGAIAPVLLVAAPQAAIVAFAAMFSGSALSVLGFFALLVPCAWALALLAQVVGLHAGKRRGPGIIGMALLALAGTWTMVGWAIAFESTFTRNTASVMALLPSGALGHFLRSAFVGHNPSHFGDSASELWWFAGRLAATAIACVVVGALALLATERRIFGRYGAPLRRSEAVLGVAVLAVLTLLAVPERSTQAWLATLAMLVIPMQILIMGRVPVGDAPEGTPRVRLGALMAEFAAFVALHAGVAMAIVGPGFLSDLELVPVLQLGWALGVAALVSIRVVARPARLPTLVWGGFAYVLAIVTFASGVAGLAGSGRHEQIFVLWQASPVLGLAQAVLTLAIPVLFVRALQRPAKMNALAKDDV